jgi:signal peptidase II
MTRSRTVFVLVAIVAAILVCDQLTKRVASTRLADGARRSYLADVLRLEYSENTGAFLGLGASWSPWVRTAIFSVGTSLILAGCLAASFSQELARAGLAGLWLLFAGGLSNLIDRIIHGRVVDFLNVGIGPLRTGIFNVADMAITFGIVLVIFGGRSARRDVDDSGPASS